MCGSLAHVVLLSLLFKFAFRVLSLSCFFKVRPHCHQLCCEVEYTFSKMDSFAVELLF